MGTAVHSTMNGNTVGLNVYGGVYVVTPQVVDPSEDYGINGYFETHLGGTLAGHVYGGGFWINIDDNFVDITGGKLICAQDNGIYEASATTFTNAKYIYGMRAEFVATSTASGGVYMFSTNTGNLLINSIFHCAGTGAEIGYVAGTVASLVGDSTGVIKFATLFNGTVLYLHAYTTDS